jgi:hypothetical protein
VLLCKSYYLQITGICQGKPKLIFDMVRPTFASRDYFGIPGDSFTPIFKDRTFQMMFRVCRSRVQRMLEDIMTTNHPFYVKSVDAAGKRGACLEAKVLLPLKTFA